MEKITVKIGIPGRASKATNKVSQTDAEMIEFLRKCFKISYNRANLLIKQFSKESFASSAYITVVLDFEQLARYTAYRQVDGLNTFWKYPHVESIVEYDEVQPEVVIELRPTYRKIGN